jgi:hypothetical protein
VLLLLRARRVRAAEAFEHEGRRLIERLRQIMEFKNLNVIKFFYRLDVNRGGQVSVSSASRHVRQAEVSPLRLMIMAGPRSTG